MIPTIAALTGADELFNHQIVNTFAAVAPPERAWTEKAWFTLMRKDGSLQASFGLGKYANRNVARWLCRGADRHAAAHRARQPGAVLRADDMGVGPLGL